MNTPFLVPLAERFFEDYAVGLIAEYGSYTVTLEEVVRFAEAFDPHLMHTDAAASVNGPFGGLVSSGWHTTAIMMRIMVDNFLNERNSLGSPGVDDLRWIKPVRPGDVLSVRFTVVAARASASKPDRGLTHTRIELMNQTGDVVMSQVMLNLLRRRSTT
jgi:acyl dehydratase